MNPLGHLRFLLHITSSHPILRRYVVVNGFDGALTMLGLLTGFRVASAVPLEAMITACIGAAVALGVSGVASAFISEAAERRLALKELEDAMIHDLETTAHGRAARLVPYLIAASNGLSPLLISLFIIIPLWLGACGYTLPLQPLDSIIGAAAGAGLGQAIGRNTESTLIGAGIGAALGGLAGWQIGEYMDRQEAELQQAFANSEAAAISREQDVLTATFKGDVFFDFDSAILRIVRDNTSCKVAKSNVELSGMACPRPPERLVRCFSIWLLWRCNL